MACQRGAYPIADAVHALRELEEEHRLHERETFEAFRRRVEDTRHQLTGLLDAIKANGERVVGVGAPAKGNTLLNFCQIGPETVDYLVEKSDLKIGKYTPGSRIKIVEESRLFADQPAYALLLSWNIKEELIPLLRGRGYRGRFLVPNPVAVIE
ncbi:MAG: hypothetical protein HYZ91_01790 [Candidatus Omnitrophica bacterium]|nr:hypothetical protein [Candidatus Omnitrophota bacterium]